jgi:hypothetical protein
VAATAEERADLLALAETVAAETTSWRRARRHGLARIQESVGKLEIASGLKREFQPVLVPGLLQPPTYALQVFRAGHRDRPDLSAAVAARMSRQEILQDQSHRFEFVILESALRIRQGTREDMHALYKHLVTVSTQPNILIAIVPQDLDLAAWHQHGFSLFEERISEPPLVHVETLTHGLSVTEPDEVERYRRAFQELREVSVVADRARELLESLQL